MNIIFHLPRLRGSLGELCPDLYVFCTCSIILFLCCAVSFNILITSTEVTIFRLNQFRTGHFCSTLNGSSARLSTHSAMCIFILVVSFTWSILNLKLKIMFASIMFIQFMYSALFPTSHSHFVLRMNLILDWLSPTHFSISSTFDLFGFWFSFYCLYPCFWPSIFILMSCDILSATSFQLPIWLLLVISLFLLLNLYSLFYLYS